MMVPRCLVEGSLDGETLGHWQTDINPLRLFIS
jgi:hypothetical protein